MARSVTALSLALGLAAVSSVGVTQPAAPDWAAIGQALGKPLSEQAGGIYRAGFPRTDLVVNVDDVEINPALALGGWLAFIPIDGNEVMVMGDLVLTEAEIAQVIPRLREGGVEITALHNHLLRGEATIMYLHVHGRGDAVELAQTFNAAIALTTTPLESAAGGEPPPLDLDVAAIDALLGAEGRNNGGVLQYSIARAETITHMGTEVPPPMGTGIVINFQPTGGGRAAIAGDFVLTSNEVNPVVTALVDHGIEVTAIHSHMLEEDPRLFFMHFWANDDALALASVLKAALDLTNREGAGAQPSVLVPLTFTSAQVSQGRGIFTNSCAGCHGEDLAGLDNGPALIGDLFARWYEGPVGLLYDYVHTRMPADRPGTLTPEQAAAVVTFILQRNGFTPGDTPLPVDAAALGQMGFRQ